jgi:hypothetical protein
MAYPGHSDRQESNEDRRDTMSDRYPVFSGMFGIY